MMFVCKYVSKKKFRSESCLIKFIFYWYILHVIFYLLKFVFYRSSLQEHHGDLITGKKGPNKVLPKAVKLEINKVVKRQTNLSMDTNDMTADVTPKPNYRHLLTYCNFPDFNPLTDSSNIVLRYGC